MNIRPYRDSDRQAVIDLWQEVFPDSPPWNDPDADIRRKLAVQPELFLVAEEQDSLVGTAMAGFDGHRGWVYYVAVSSRQRRRGIGTDLMRRVEQELSRMGCTKLNLQVRAGNEQVTAFYRRLGYSVEERVSMAKRLSSNDAT